MSLISTRLTIASTYVPGRPLLCYILVIHYIIKEIGNGRI